MYTKNELHSTPESIFPAQPMPEIEHGIDALFNPNIVSSKEEKIVPDNWSVFYRVFDVEVDTQRESLEGVMSDCMNGKKMLCFEETSWDKLGRLRIALKWAELPSGKTSL